MYIYIYIYIITNIYIYIYILLQIYIIIYIYNNIYIYIYIYNIQYYYYNKLWTYECKDCKYPKYTNNWWFYKKYIKYFRMLIRKNIFIIIKEET